MQLTIDLSSSRDTVRPLHGVNNGPKYNGFYRDASQLFRDAGIPLVRLHDTEYPFGSGAFVDIPCIFKNFDADENDPASYDFSQTDLYLQAIVDAGAKPFYRLGVSIEHTPVKRNVYAPRDPEKWARICEHIVRHYNDGWADGKHLGIEYWEIWNEPEQTAMWIGTKEQFFALYAAAARVIKAAHPDVKLGGYGSCGFYTLTRHSDRESTNETWAYFKTYAEDFLKFVRENNLPLDFFSWHIYDEDPTHVGIHARFVRKLLDDNGFRKTESILDEWNLSGKDMFERMNGAEGAAHVAGVLCQMQQNAVDAATYYDSQPLLPYCGIFKMTTLEPTKAYYPFKYWNALYTAGQTLACVSDDPELRAVAATDGKKVYVIVSVRKPTDELLTVKLEGLSEKCAFTVRATDAAHDNTQVEQGHFYAEYPFARIITVGYSALLIEIG
ncbi:MAG: GH39 family glycosyl hydrolase [Eubacteriales bacterium]|jgi:xylan 1,4-beta-xylosidase